MSPPRNLAARALLGLPAIVQLIEAEVDLGILDESAGGVIDQAEHEPIGPYRKV